MGTPDALDRADTNPDRFGHGGLADIASEVACDRVRSFGGYKSASLPHICRIRSLTHMAH